MENDALKQLYELVDFYVILKSIFVLIMTAVLIAAVKYLVGIFAERFNKYRIQISRLYPMSRIFLWAAAIGIVIFAVIRPPQNAIIALSASAGVALGLGIQDIAKNIFAGIMILFDRPFTTGDIIDFKEHHGEVLNISLSTTKIRTFDDSVVTIPNSVVVTQAVSNSNTGALDEMVVIEFDLPADVDVEPVRRICREAAEACPYTYLKKPISVMISDKFDKAFLTHFKVKAYTLDLRYEQILKTDILLRIKNRLSEIPELYR